MNFDAAFINSVSFEENPFFNERPDETKLYDFSGNEVIPNAAE